MAISQGNLTRLHTLISLQDALSNKIELRASKVLQSSDILIYIDGELAGDFKTLEGNKELKISQDKTNFNIKRVNDSLVLAWVSGFAIKVRGLFYYEQDFFTNITGILKSTNIYPVSIISCILV